MQLTACPVHAQDLSVDVAIIETNLDNDDATIKPDASLADVATQVEFKEGPDRIVVKKSNVENIEIQRRQLIQTHQSLRKAIEANQNLKRSVQQLDGELRSLRGQRTIELNRINAVLIERDAYKEQNETISEVKKQMEKDVQEYRSKLDRQERELQLEISRLEKELESYDASMRNDTVVQELQSKISLLETQRALLQKDLEEKNNMLKDLALLQANYDRLKKEMEDKEKYSNEWKAKNEAETRKVQQLESDLARVEKRLARAKRFGGAVEETKPMIEDENTAGEGLKPSPAKTTPPPETTDSQEVLKAQTKSLDIIEMVESLNQQNARLKEEEGKIHYNMGNIFFKQGQYGNALKEYQKAVALIPTDANAHFNIAFVAGEFLLDMQTSKRHYQKYLEFKPEADDINLVKEKILEAELYLKSRIPSPMEKVTDDEWRRYKTQ